MLWNMWELKAMYDKYKKLQEALKNTIIRAREWGILIDMSAEMKMKDFKVEDENLLSISSKETLEKAVMAAYEKAQNKVQEVATQKTQEILGFNPNDLAGMLWGGGGMPKIPGM